MVADKKRGLLINPAKKGGVSSRRAHLGLLLLAQILESQGHDVRILDFVFLQSCKGLRTPSLADEIRDYLPDVVGISVFTYHYDEASETIDLVNRTTDAPIVLGGPHISIFPDDLVA